MTKRELTTKKDLQQKRMNANKLDIKKTAILWAGIGVGVIALSIGSFFIANHLTAPETPEINSSDRLIEDDYVEEVDKTLSQVTKPGSSIAEGSTGKATISRDAKTNYPLVGDIKLNTVQEVDPMNIGPLKLEDPILGEYNARVWYVTATITVDKKPSDDTYIDFPVLMMNNQTPADDVKGLVFPKDNPDCLWGPEYWGEAKDTTVTKCQTVVTFNNEDAGDIALKYNAINLEDHPEYANNPATFKFSAKGIKD